MKTNSIITLGGVCALLLTGCASRQPMALSPVGPDTVWYDQASLRGVGFLKVYSDTETHQIGDGPPYRTHTGYNIHDLSGARIKYVPNHIGDMDQSPTPVQIKAGKYYVVAKTTGYGRVKVPVVIKPDRTTEVYLDGSWRSAPPAGSSSVVCLPNGEPVGWKDSVAGQ